MDPEEVSVGEARRDLRKLLNSVEHDSAHITITRYGTPAAVIVPREWYEQAKAALEAP
jgi:prevent-host-death family protein